MKLSPHLRLGAKPLSHQAKRGVTPIVKSLRPRRRADRPRLSDATRTVVLRRWGGLGCMCGCGCEVQPSNPACWHHVFPKQRYPELIDDPNNLVLVAVDCHANHENASRRLPRKVTRHAALLAEGNPAMKDYLARNYA